MKEPFKSSIILFLGITISSITFGLATELSTKKKVTENTLEDLGIVYRSNELYKNTKSVEAQISKYIKTALAGNPKTSTLNLNIITVGSRVTISGKAEDKEQIQSAIQTALTVPGVKEIISTVVIDPEIQLANKGSLL